MEPESVVYNGTSKTPSVKLVAGETTFEEGTDYEVIYSDNINVGTATVTITGIGNCVGEIATTFEIEAAQITEATLGTVTYTYDGKAKTPSVTVKSGAVVLVEGTDYTVTYSNNVNIGTATATVTGKGNYSGTIVKTYEIELPLLTINFDANGGSVGTSKKTVEAGSALGTMPTPTRTGYTFTGWYTVATGGSKVYSTTKATKSMTLYAQWKKSTYNINFNANGGSVGTAKKTVEVGSTLGTMPTPTRTGYTFTGWYTAAAGGTKVYSTTKATKSMTLYAQWKIKTYTINFNGNGGTVGVEKKWVNAGEPMNFMPTPKRTGYIFTGWYTAATGGKKVYSTTKVTKNMTLYAQWKKK